MFLFLVRKMEVIYLWFNVVYKMHMTYYHQQVQKIDRNIYPKEYLREKVIKSKSFIDTYFSENIDLDEIAREVFISKFHFIRLFKKYYGRTPHQYLTSVRIAKAKELLQTGCTVSETCYSLGFTSLSSFTGFFKKIGGLTPNDYRRKKATLKKSD
jgi:AraC-like DNA-binding protein